MEVGLALEKFKIRSLPEAMVPYEYQLCGHGTKDRATETQLLRHSTQPLIFKPVQDHHRGVTEVEFYEQVFSNLAPVTILLLRSFLPMYEGVFCSKNVYFIGLEDVLAGLKHPSICDLKMGTQSYPPEAPFNKRVNEDAKYAFRGEVGFLLSGMKVYEPNLNSTLEMPKVYCRTLNPQRMYSHGIRSFLGPNVSRHSPLAKQFLDKLLNLRQWFMEQHCVAFYASSLLLAYDSEGDGDGVDLRLIDFANCRVSVGDQRIADESGFTYGLSFLIKLLTKAQADSCPLPTDIPWT